MGHSKGKKDNNHDEIRAYLERNGCVVIPCNEYPELGFDMLVLSPDGLHIVEIKNPQLAWELTKCEESRREQCLKMGVKYEVIEWKCQAADMLGIRYTEPLEF